MKKYHKDSIVINTIIRLVEMKNQKELVRYVNWLVK